jgi:hypothetical protein
MAVAGFAESQSSFGGIEEGNDPEKFGYINYRSHGGGCYHCHS